MFQNIAKLIAVESGLDAQKADFQDDQPAEHRQGVFFQSRFPGRRLVVEFMHQPGDKILIGGGMGLLRQ